MNQENQASGTSVKFEVSATYIESELSKAWGRHGQWVGLVNGVRYGSGSSQQEAITGALQILAEGIERDGLEASFSRIESLS